MLIGLIDMVWLCKKCCAKCRQGGCGCCGCCCCCNSAGHQGVVIGGVETNGIEVQVIDGAGNVVPNDPDCLTDDFDALSNRDTDALISPE